MVECWSSKSKVGGSNPSSPEIVIVAIWNIVLGCYLTKIIKTKYEWLMSILGKPI